MLKALGRYIHGQILKTEEEDSGNAFKKLEY